MEISNGTTKKRLLARKTMNQSCRQQVEILNKIKDIWEPEKTSKETYNVQSVQFKKSVDIICKNNYFAQENSVSELSKMSHLSEAKEVCSSKLNVSIEVLDVDSGENIGCCLNKSVTCSADHQNKSQDPFKEKSTQKKENSACLKFPRDSLLQNIVVNTSVNKTELFLSKPPPQENTGFTAAHNCEDETDRMIPVLEKMTPRLNPNMENEDLTIPVLEKFTMVEDSKHAQLTENVVHRDAVTDKYVKYMDTSVSSITRTLHSEDNTAGDGSSSTSGRSNDQNTSQGAKTVFPLDLSAESKIGVTQRKRIHSENDENTKRKHQKMGDEKQVSSHVESEATEVCLEKVRYLIEQQICIFFRSAFDQRLEELIERVKQIQCRKKHEELAAKCLHKLHKIENRVNLLATQKEDAQSQRLLLSKSDSSKVAVTVSNSNWNFHLNNQSDKQSSGTSVSPNIAAEQTSAVKPHKEFLNTVPSSQIGDNSKDPVILCDTDTDSCISDSEDVQLNSTRTILSEGLKNSGEQVSKVSSTSGEVKIQPENMVPKAAALEQTVPVVDLTEDEDQQKSGKDMPPKRQKIDMGNGSKIIPATPGHESAVSSNTSSTPLNSKSKQAEASQNGRDSISLQKTSYPDPVLPVEMNNTVPPQKYELQLTEVINPRGIALSWNVSKINPRCAAVQSYYLYMCQETSKTSTAKWVKVGEIKAMPLPMACTLTQFVSGSKYHFTMRAKDIYGHYGPFCDVQSITLHFSDQPGSA